MNNDQLIILYFSISDKICTELCICCYFSNYNGMNSIFGTDHNYHE